LPPERRWLDVEAFRQAAQGDDLPDWLHALALYRGYLLEGAYADWLLEEREHLYYRHIASPMHPSFDPSRKPSLPHTFLFTGVII
jgi:hypothetical protein